MISNTRTRYCIEKIMKRSSQFLTLDTKIIPALAAVAIAAVVLTSLAILSQNNILPGQTNAPDSFGEWECAGPICIRPTEARLGENIFITAKEIPEDLTLRLAITNPNGKIWTYLWADGSHKTEWNKYIKPDFSQSSGFCTMNDLTGLWTIELQGTKEGALQFQYGPEILEGEEAHYKAGKNVCP